MISGCIKVINLVQPLLIRLSHRSYLIRLLDSSMRSPLYYFTICQTHPFWCIRITYDRLTEKNLKPDTGCRIASMYEIKMIAITVHCIADK